MNKEIIKKHLPAITILAVALIILSSVGYIITTSMIHQLEIIPQEFYIVKKDVHTNKFWFWDSYTYCLYYNQTHWVNVFESEYNKWHVGDYFNGSIVFENGLG